LDGSPGGYYLQKGTQSDKWLIVFQGGGWCWNQEECANRAMTPFGSSSHWQKCLSTSDVNTFGYLSNGVHSKVENSPLIEFNKVLVHYCDGGSFAGENSGNHEGKTLFYQGSHIRKAVINTLLFGSPAMKMASEVVVAGASAGGLAVLMGLDDIAKHIESQASGVRVVGLVDSGIFPDRASVGKRPYKQVGHNSRPDSLDATGHHIDYGYGMRNIATFMNLEAGSNKACTKNSPISRPCLFAEHLAPYIRTPVFFIQSQFDSWNTRHILGSVDSIEINIFGLNVTNSVRKLLSDTSGQDKRTARGAFIHSCRSHTTDVRAWEQDLVDHFGRTPAQVFNQWYLAIVRGEQISAIHKIFPRKFAVRDIGFQRYPKYGQKGGMGVQANKNYRPVMYRSDNHGSTRRNEHLHGRGYERTQQLQGRYHRRQLSNIPSSIDESVREMFAYQIERYPCVACCRRPKQKNSLMK
jgi:hypothetical protein